MKVKLNSVRIAFPAVFEAKAVNGEGEPRFSATLIIESDSENYKAIAAAIDEVGSAKFGAQWKAVKKQLEAQDRTALHDGDLKEGYDGFGGNFYVTASNKSRPLVVDRDRSPLTSADGRPYAGCYVNARIELWAMDNKYGRRINAQLRGVQFVKHGDAFAGSPASSDDEFDDVTEDDCSDLV